MRQITITVVVPVYNASGCLGRCVAALCAQTRKDFEVVFIDDCSTDDSFERLEQLLPTTSLKYTIIRNEVNAGPAKSRNTGIVNTVTDYITFCDIDDWYEPDFLEVMYGELVETDAELVFCGYKVVDDDKHEIKRPISAKEGRVRDEDIFTLNADSLCMMMTKTELMKDTLLPDLRNGEDVATVSLLIAKANGIAVTDKCLYNYYRRVGSASENPTMKVVDSLVSSFYYTKEHFPLDKREELEYLGINNLLYAAIISLFTFSNDSKKAKEIMSRFESVFPKWWENKYIKYINNYKKVVLFFIRYRLFIAVKGIAIMRKSMLK